MDKRTALEEDHKRMKRIREEIGISQAELAKELGVTSQAVSYWETNKRPIPKMAWIAIEGPSVADQVAKK